MSDVTINVDRTVGPMAQARRSAVELYERGSRALCCLDARLRTLTAEPEEGAATAEYAVVLVAATSFAAVLMAVLKSDGIKTLLTGLVKKALNVG